MENRPFDNRDNDSEIEKPPRVRRPRGGTTNQAVQAAPPEPRWRAFWRHPVVRIAIFGLIYFAVSQLIRFVIGVVFANTGRLPRLQEYNNYPYWMVLLPLAGMVGALVALWLTKRSEGWALWKSSGFGFQRAGQAVLIGLGVALAILIITFGLAVVFGHRASSAILAPRFQFATIWAYSISATVLRTITNETSFRGFVLPELERRWGTTVSLMVTCLLYCVIFNWYRILYPIEDGTFYSSGSRLLFLEEISNSIAVSLLLSAAYLVTRSLWAPIVLSISTALGIFSLEIIRFRWVWFLNFEVSLFVNLLAAAWLIYWAIQRGQWKPGPGPGEMFRSMRDNVVKIVEATDPAKEVDARQIDPATRQ